MVQLPPRRTLLIILILLVVLIISASPFSGRTVTVVSPTRGPAVEAVYATGTVEGSEMFPIAPRIPGRIVELLVDEAAAVEKDILLARLEADELEATVSQLKAREEFARREYERSARLVEKDAVARSQFERNNADWLAARDAVAAAEAQFEYTQLRAPAAGRIVRRDGEVGELIPAMQPIFWMTTEAPLRVSAEVDEEDIAHVVSGQHVLLRADAFPGQTFKGFVQSITPKGDPIARSFRVRIGFESAVPLRLGMTTEANIIIHQVDDALLVPSSALEGENVWIVLDGRLVRRQVSVGVRGETQTEVLTGLSLEDKVVITPSGSLREGARAKVRQG